MKFGDVGLAANGEEPALKGKTSYVNADMSLVTSALGEELLARFRSSSVIAVSVMEMRICSHLKRE